jgi:hypothetical protein
MQKIPETRRYFLNEKLTEPDPIIPYCPRHRTRK